MSEQEEKVVSPVEANAAEVESEVKTDIMATTVHNENDPVVSTAALLEAGAHFGHQTRRWEPKMKPYIFMARNDIHILNLEKTSEQIYFFTKC